jgi:hypothetical protein
MPHQLQFYKKRWALIIFVLKKNCFFRRTSAFLYQFTTMTIKLAVVIIDEYHCYQFLIQFGVTTKLVRLMKRSLNESLYWQIFV